MGQYRVNYEAHIRELQSNYRSNSCELRVQLRANLWYFIVLYGTFDTLWYSMVFYCTLWYFMHFDYFRILCCTFVVLVYTFWYFFLVLQAKKATRGSYIGVLQASTGKYKLLLSFLLLQFNRGY